MSTCVVIPSIRQPNLEYLEPLGDTPIVVIDDSDGNISKNLAPHITVLDYADRKKLMGKDEWLIAKKSPSCKNLGLFWAWKEKFDTVILLDDDCDLRVSPDYLDKVPVNKEVLHSEVITEAPWFNSMGCLGQDGLIFARGLPYEFRHLPQSYGEHKPVVSKFNQGMWTRTPDINGADQFYLEDVTRDYTLERSVFLKPNLYLACSIMSVQISAELIPAFWQPPDWPITGGFKISRHDDVHSALFVKFLMDAKGDVMTCGAPMIAHMKPADRTKMMLMEHVSNIIQHHVYTTIASAAEGIFPYEAKMSYAYLAEVLGKLMLKTNDAPGSFHTIIDDYARGIMAWAKLFR